MERGSGGKKVALTRDDILEGKPAFNTAHSTTHPKQLHDYIDISYFLTLVARWILWRSLLYGLWQAVLLGLDQWHQWNFTQFSCFSQVVERCLSTEWGSDGTQLEVLMPSARSPAWRCWCRNRAGEQWFFSCTDVDSFDSLQMLLWVLSKSPILMYFGVLAALLTTPSNFCGNKMDLLRCPQVWFVGETCNWSSHDPCSNKFE